MHLATEPALCLLFLYLFDFFGLFVFVFEFFDVFFHFALYLIYCLVDVSASEIEFVELIKLIVF